MLLTRSLYVLPVLKVVCSIMTNVNVRNEYCALISTSKIQFSCLRFALSRIVVLNVFLRQGQIFPYAEVSTETGPKFLQYATQESPR